MEPTCLFRRCSRSIRLLSTTEDIDCDLLAFANQRFQELTSSVWQPEVSSALTNGLPGNDISRNKPNRKMLSHSQEKRRTCSKAYEKRISKDDIIPQRNYCKRVDKAVCRKSTPLGFNAGVSRHGRPMSHRRNVAQKQASAAMDADSNAMLSCIQETKTLEDENYQKRHQNFANFEKEPKHSEWAPRKLKKSIHRRKRRRRSLFELPTGSQFDLLIETGKFKTFMARATRM